VKLDIDLGAEPLIGANQADVADAHGVEFALAGAAPAFEKVVELGEVGQPIQRLPKEALDELGVVGLVIEDLFDHPLSSH
jgi:hypothetical protein